MRIRSYLVCVCVFVYLELSQDITWINMVDKRATYLTTPPKLESILSTINAIKFIQLSTRALISIMPYSPT